jgi:hypothetical protein
MSITDVAAVSYGGNHTYFVDQVNGNDSWHGYHRSDSAWATIAKVRGYSFADGDTILLKRGCTWHEVLVVPRNGLLFGNYGSGNKPMLDAATVLTGFVADAGSVYKKTSVSSSYCLQVFQDATRLILESSRGAMVAGSSFYDSGTSTLYVWCTDNANPSMHTIEATPNYARGIDFNGKDNITLDGMDQERAWFGFDFGNVLGSHVATISKCALYYNDDRGINFGGYKDLGITNVLLDRDSVYNCRTEEGFWLGNGTEVAQYCYGTGSTPDFRVGLRGVDCKFLHCRSVNPQGPSLYIEREVGYARPLRTVISDCWLEGSTGSVAVANAGVNTTFNYNVIIGNSTVPNYVNALYIGGDSAANTVLYNNTIIGKSGVGTVIEFDNETNLTFKNNIVVGPSGMKMVYFDSHFSGWVSDYNDWQGTGKIEVGGLGNYSTLAAFAAVVGGETHSITTDPLFTTNYIDFHLQGRSHCINAGTSVGLTTDFDGNAILGNPEIGAYEYYRSPPALPFPVGSFSASPDTLVTNGLVTLTWTDSNATSASINNGVGSVPTKGGKLSVAADTSVTFILTLTNSAGSRNYEAPITVLSPARGTASSLPPVRFSLRQNYPNPFNPSTTIRYDVPWASHVTITVFDVLGRQVSVLVNETREAGVHEVKFDGSNLASGVYFYYLQAGSFVDTKALLLLR